MPDAVTGVTSARRVFWSVLAGSLLLQLAWIVALPTFRGPDEFDHVYKADAVVAGQLRGTEPAQRGRGDLLDVRRGVAEAAGPLCSSYAYTGPDNCRPVRSSRDGRVVVASAAASYNPAYYLLVATPTQWLDGHAFDLGLRLLTSALVALLLAAAAATAASRARTAWPLVAVGLTYTPTVALSGATAAPNGVAYAAAALWWASSLAVADDRRPPWARLGVASGLLLVTHTLNVLWLPVMTLAVLALSPPAAWVGRLRARRPVVVIAAVATTAAASVVWIRLAGTNRLNEPVPGAGTVPVVDLVSSQVVWALQTVAVGPVRADPAPLGVYAVWVVALVAVGVAAWRRADRRTRLVSIGLLAAWVVVPMVLTVVSYASEGLAWQGRYAIPLVVGLAFLAGRALDRVPPENRALPWGAVALALTQVWCVVGVLVDESGSTRSASLVEHVGLPGSLAVVAVLAVTGALVVLRASTRHVAADSQVPEKASSPA